MLPRSPLAPLLPVALLPVALAWVTGGVACVQPDPGVPLDEPVFPTGMAVAGDRLLVVSSDFEQDHDEGALLSADLQAVREATAESGGDDVVEGAYDKAAVLPSFGDRPVVTSGAERAYVPTGETNRVVVFDVGADGELTCPEGPVEDDRERERDVALCGEN